jgi:ABC-type nitrate/sulfonate/bicarbonate transport system permease component
MNLITPFAEITKRTWLLLVIVESAVAIILWQMAAKGSVIPTPIVVAQTLITVIPTTSFLDNLTSSILLTFKSMLVSIIIALTFSYLVKLPIIKPITALIVQFRYLTLGGLIFFFTLITKDASRLKMSLLIFGIVPFFVTSLWAIILQIKEEEYNLCKTLRMGNWETLYEVIILGLADQVIEVMRQNFAIAWLMITMVEGLCMSQGGLGMMIVRDNKYLAFGMPYVFSDLIIIFVLGIGFDTLFKKIRAWFFPYSRLQVKS